MPNLYIIAGCNGAGKTTASFTVLPEMLNCEDFVNADEIARGLSPLKPENAAIEAGRIMLQKIDNFIEQGKDFAFETTLATRSYINTIRKAQKKGYGVTLLFFWLDSTDLAIERVKARVSEGGHNIPSNIIVRRYFNGLKNLFNLYIPQTDYWMVFDNSNMAAALIAEGNTDQELSIQNMIIFERLKKLGNHEK
ncbi:zeta toxin family protein [Marinilabilia rubra]|uniref:Zeta toxin n=1 Tax=Marinilabilia rubra TaxID=2162893 RepID=A0A2U2B3X1_9BACT|nr:zeta toxin family protein [Marinilabilia rubra]PWD97737.1 zeta toxin [Marinilabilia rubra]